MTATDKRHDDKIEPVCYNPTPGLMYESIMKGFFVKFVFDLTPLDSTVGWQCILNHIGYIGICFTEEHAELLNNRFMELLKVEMGNSANSNIYNPSYALAIGKEQKKEVTPKGTAVTKKKAKASKAAAKPKTEKAKTDDDQTVSSSEGEESDVWDPLND